MADLKKPLKIPLSEYRSHMGTDTGRKMVEEEGMAPDLPMVKAEKPSLGGFLGHMKEKMDGAVQRFTQPKRLIDMGRKAREIGAGMREAADINEEMKKPGGLTMEGWQRIREEKRKRMEE